MYTLASSTKNSRVTAAVVFLLSKWMFLATRRRTFEFPCLLPPEALVTFVVLHRHLVEFLLTFGTVLLGGEGGGERFFFLFTTMRARTVFRFRCTLARNVDAHTRSNLYDERARPSTGRERVSECSVDQAHYEQRMVYSLPPPPAGESEVCDDEEAPLW